MICRSLATRLVLLLGVACLALLPACGGVGSGGTGMPSGTAQGTVNGFGSVFVDGVRYDDSQVPTLRENEPGVETQTAAVLGDTLVVEHASDGVASRVVVDATLIGPVTAIPAPGSFVVLGQTVVVNGDALRGPITQFSGGYVNSASVVVGDAVEVHGLIVPQGGAFSIQATRVGHLSVLPTYLKATGLVSLLGPSGFNLGTLKVVTANASLVPQGAMLANGAVVSVLADKASNAATAGAPTLVASQVRIKKIGSEGDQVSISGLVVGLDTVAARFELGGVPVQYGNATVSPSGAHLVAGRYVRVTGEVAADGSLRASTVTIRDGVSEPDAELKGDISGFVAATKTFVVRGVTVDATTAQLEGCPASGLADGL